MANILSVVAGALLSVLTSIGEFMGIIVNQGEVLYNKLTDEEKQAAQWGSGLLHLVNSNLDALPADIVTLIKQEFPTLDVEVVHGFVDELLTKINNIQGEVPLTLEDAIGALQTYLKQYEGDNSVWGVISKTAATLLGLAFSPTTAAQKIEGVLEYVYHLIIKPNVSTTIVAAVNTASTIVNEVAPGSEAATVATEVDNEINTVGDTPAPVETPAPTMSFDEAEKAENTPTAEG